MYFHVLEASFDDGLHPTIVLLKYFLQFVYNQFFALSKRLDYPRNYLNNTIQLAANFVFK